MTPFSGPGLNQSSAQGWLTRSGSSPPGACTEFNSWPSRFGPSPLYQRGTMASADLCPITFRIAPGRAAGAAVGSGGLSRPFGLGLSPAPMATPGRKSSRSPRIRTCALAAQPRHLPCPPNHRALSCCADSPRGCLSAVLTAQAGRPSMTFVFLPALSADRGSQLCRRLPSDSPSRDRPCLNLVVGVQCIDGGSPLRGLPPHKHMPMTGRTQDNPADLVPRRLISAFDACVDRREENSAISPSSRL